MNLVTRAKENLWYFFRCPYCLKYFVDRLWNATTLEKVGSNKEGNIDGIVSIQDKQEGTYFICPDCGSDCVMANGELKTLLDSLFRE